MATVEYQPGRAGRVCTVVFTSTYEEVEAVSRELRQNGREGWLAALCYQLHTMGCPVPVYDGFRTTVEDRDAPAALDAAVIAGALLRLFMQDDSEAALLIRVFEHAVDPVRSFRIEQHGFSRTYTLVITAETPYASGGLLVEPTNDASDYFKRKIAEAEQESGVEADEPQPPHEEAPRRLKVRRRK